MSINKNILLKEVINTLKQDKVSEWCEKYLTGTNQAKTIDILMVGILNNEILIRDALMIAFVTGFQWDIKFEGVE